MTAPKISTVSAPASVEWFGQTSFTAPAEATALDEVCVAAAGRLTRDVPVEVFDAVCAFASQPPPSGVLLIRGVPIGDLPATPATPRAAAGKDRRTEMLLLAVARLLGHPVGYLPEHGGDLVQNIVPVQATADRQVSTSSRVQLEFHTEAAFHPHRPRYLLLLCLRGDPSAETTYCSVRDMVAVLDPAQVEILRQARFATGVDESYIGFRSDALGPAMPVLSGPSGQERICFDGDLMVGLDPEADAAIESLRIATRRVQGGVVLTAGDLLVIDNTVAVHGRTPFTPRFDGTDRWLQRTFVVNDLAASADDRRGRIIATEFTATYPQ